jgi:hypothetical protein
MTAASISMPGTDRGEMTLTNLPRLIVAFLDAVGSGDWETVRRLFESDARVRGLVDLPVRDAIERWADFAEDRSATLHPINVERRDQQTVVTLLVSTRESSRRMQAELGFRMEAGRIAALEAILSQPLNVAPSIAAFIDAVNAWDLEALLATFAVDAMVNDQLEEFWGVDTIRGWAQNSVISERLTMFVTRVCHHHGCVIVRANVDGDYDKRELPDTLSLAFYFYSVAGRIVQLLILRNQSERPD